MTASLSEIKRCGAAAAAREPVSEIVPDLASVGVMVVDQQERIIFANSWLRARWRGDGSGDRLVGQTLGEALRDTPSSRLTAAVRACLSDGAPARLTHLLNPNLLPLRHPLDPSMALAQSISIQATSAPAGRAADETGPERFCLIEALDVSLQSERETLLRSEIDTLTRAYENLEVFSNAASHDLKAPLRAVQLLSGRIEAEISNRDLALPADIADHIARIGRRAAQMNGMLDDLLAYCRLDQETNAARRLASRPIALEAAELAAPPRTFTVTTAATLPDVWCAPAELGLVLRNLIANAAAHHDRASGEIVIDGGEDAECSHLSVTDDGPGVPADMLGQIFDPFVSGNGGSGLGLAMVDRIMRKLGGSISIAAPVHGGRGARFTARFPKRKIEEA